MTNGQPPKIVDQAEGTTRRKRREEKPRRGGNYLMRLSNSLDGASIASILTRRASLCARRPCLFCASVFVTPGRTAKRKAAFFSASSPPAMQFCARKLVPLGTRANLSRWEDVPSRDRFGNRVTRVYTPSQETCCAWGHLAPRSAVPLGEGAKRRSRHIAQKRIEGSRDMRPSFRVTVGERHSS